MTRDVARSIVTVWSVSYLSLVYDKLRHCVVDLPYLLSGSVPILVYPPSNLCSRNLGEINAKGSERDGSGVDSAKNRECWGCGEKAEGRLFDDNEREVRLVGLSRTSRGTKGRL